MLLLDEPFGALDAKVRKDLRRWLREIHDRTGHTTLFVTHDQDEALELADRVAILNQGRIEQVGSADEIYDRPASAFVTTFVGETARSPSRVRGRAPCSTAAISASPRKAAPKARRLSTCARSISASAMALLAKVWRACPAASSRFVAPARAAAREVAVNEKGDIIELDLPVTTPVAPGDIIPIRIGRCWVFPDGA